MALPDWNADMVKGKVIKDPQWSPCSPTALSIAKQQHARHGTAINVGATVADSADAETFIPKK